MLIDTHAHLTDPRVDYKTVLAGMETDGLSRIITVGYNLGSSLGGLEIAKTAGSGGKVFCALGFHPSNTGEVKSRDYDNFLKLSKDEKVAAIGEIGLDYHYPDTDKACQQKELLAQLELVKNASLPAIFHLREADADFYSLIKNNLSMLPKGAVMHCFSGSRDTAVQYVKLGFYISFSGTVTFSNAAKFPEIIRAVPRDKILIETDCPYLAPEPFRGKTNYPKYVRLTAEFIAKTLSLTFEEAAGLTAKNAFTCFDKLR
jgi:TatD DNase family protein